MFSIMVLYSSLHIDSLVWSKIQTSGSPPARYEHASTIGYRKGEKCLFIAFGATEEAPLNDIWSLNLGMFLIS